MEKQKRPEAIRGSGQIWPRPRAICTYVHVPCTYHAFRLGEFMPAIPPPLALLNPSGRCPRARLAEDMPRGQRAWSTDAVITVGYHDVHADGRACMSALNKVP